MAPVLCFVFALMLRAAEMSMKGLQWQATTFALIMAYCLLARDK